MKTLVESKPQGVTELRLRWLMLLVTGAMFMEILTGRSS
jgi:hypothetical protein